MTATASSAASRSHEAEKLLERFLKNKKLGAELRERAYQNAVGCTIVIARHRETFMQARCPEMAVTIHHAGTANTSVKGIRVRIAYNAAMNLRAIPSQRLGRTCTEPSNESLDSVSAIRTKRHVIAVTGLRDPHMNELFAIVLAVILDELTREQLIELCVESGNKWIVQVPGPRSKETLLDC